MSTFRISFICMTLLLVSCTKNNEVTNSGNVSSASTRETGQCDKGFNLQKVGNNNYCCTGGEGGLGTCILKSPTFQLTSCKPGDRRSRVEQVIKNDICRGNDCWGKEVGLPYTAEIRNTTYYEQCMPHSDFPEMNTFHPICYDGTVTTYLCEPKEMTCKSGAERAPYIKDPPLKEEYTSCPDDFDRDNFTSRNPGLKLSTDAGGAESMVEQFQKDLQLYNLEKQKNAPLRLKSNIK